MEHLWTPWRLAYVSGSGESNGCVFCPPAAPVTTDAPSRQAPADSFDALVLFRGTSCFVILNIFPYNNGHLMVVTNRHIAALAEATA